MGNIQNGEIDYTDIVYTKNVTEEEKYLLKKDDLLFNRTNSPELVGKTAIYRGEVPAIFAGYLIRVAPIIIIPDFLNYLMNLDFHRSLCAYSKSDGVSQSNINAQKLSNFFFPIPPLFEQERITSVIKSTFALIDEVEAGRFSIEQLIKQAKIKILDLAIRGKLVKQNPKDEPVSTFMGKIGNKQNVQKITTDIFHYPFKVPNGWIWCTLKEIAAVSLGKTLDRQKNKGSFKPYLRSVNVRWGYIDLEDIKEMRFEESELDRFSISYNDLLICEGGEAGRSAVWKFDNLPMRYQNAIHRVRFANGIVPDFYMYVLWYYFNAKILDEFCKGVTIKHLTGQSLSLLKFPVPPVSEQQRIVKKIEVIFHEINSIQDNL